MILRNGFSVSVLPVSDPKTLKFRPITTDEARKLLSAGFASAVDNQLVANMISYKLNLQFVAFDTKVWIGDSASNHSKQFVCRLPSGNMHRSLSMVIAQYGGPKPAASDTELPKGAHIDFFEVTIVE